MQLNNVHEVALVGVKFGSFNAIWGQVLDKSGYFKKKTLFWMFLQRSLNDPPPPHFKLLSLLPPHPPPPKKIDHTLIIFFSETCKRRKERVGEEGLEQVIYRALLTLQICIHFERPTAEVLVELWHSKRIAC